MGTIPNHKMGEALEQLTPDDFARVGLPDLRHIPAGLRPFSYSVIVLGQCPMPSGYYDVMAAFCEKQGIDWTPPAAATDQTASNIIPMPSPITDTKSTERDGLRDELDAAYQTIAALQAENRQLQDIIRMQAMFAEGQAPAAILPGQVVINLGALREAVASLRQRHHGRNALVELLVNVDVCTGQTKMSAAELSQSVGLGSRTSYERLFGKTFAHDGKVVTLEFVVPHATNEVLTPSNVVPGATNIPDDTPRIEVGNEKMLYPVQHPSENVVPGATFPPNNPENVVPGATNERSYDMNDDINKKSSNDKDHSFMPNQDADKKPPLEIRPVVFWLAEQTGWNWREWEKIEWGKRSRVEWIALGLHCLEHGDNPAGLFVSLAKKGQPVQAKFLETAKRIQLPPAVVIENGKVVHVQQSA